MNFATLVPSPKSARTDRKKVSPVASPVSPFQVVPDSRSTTVSEHTPNTSRSFGCGNSIESSFGPRHERMIRRMCLRSFLRANGFKEGDPHSARGGGCFFKRESVYPIHVAAMQGEYDVLEILLEEGVDVEKETSRGRSVMDCALAGDVCGSNHMVVKLLQQWLKKWTDGTGLGHDWPSLAVTGHQPSMALSRWRLSISAWAPLSGWRALGSTAHFPQRLLAARAAGGLQRLGLQRFFLSTVSDARFCRSCGLFLKSNGFSGCRFLYFPFPDMNTRFGSDSSPHITC